MKIQSLRYFITLAGSTSINDAAKKLYMSQSSLTRSLQLLEDELGAPLFYRSRSGVTLTDFGKRILPDAIKMVECYDGWLSMNAESQINAVDFYIHTSFPNFLLPDLILRFKQLHPQLKITSTETAAPERYFSQELSRPALSMLPCVPGDRICEMADRAGNRSDVLLHGKYVCLFNKDSPLSQKESISPEDLRDYFLVLPEMDPVQDHYSFLTTVLNKMFTVISREQVFYVDCVNSVIGVIHRHANTYAISYYPALKRYVAVAGHDLDYRPISGIDTDSDFCLFYSGKAYDRHPLIREIVQAIHDSATEFVNRYDDAMFRGQ